MNRRMVLGVALAFVWAEAARAQEVDTDGVEIMVRRFLRDHALRHDGLAAQPPLREDRMARQRFFVSRVRDALSRFVERVDPARPPYAPFHDPESLGDEGVAFAISAVDQGRRALAEVRPAGRPDTPPITFHALHQLGGWRIEDISYPDGSRLRTRLGLP